MDAFPSLLKGRLRTVVTAVGIFWLGLAAPQRAVADPCPPEGDPPSFCYVWDDTEGVCAWVPGPPNEPPPGLCLYWDADSCSWISEEEQCSSPLFWYDGTVQNPVCACVPCDQIPQPPAPSPAACYNWNGDACQWELANPQPGPCYQFNPATCDWDPPAEQASECEVWNEGNCSWELPSQPGPCWTWEEGDCAWIEPAGPPEGCWDSDGNCGWVAMDTTCTFPQVWIEADCACGDDCDPGPEPTTGCPVLSADGCSWEEMTCPPGQVPDANCECVDCEPTEPEPPCSVWNPDSCQWDEMEPPCGPDEIRDASCACVPGCPGPSGEQPPCTEWSWEACDWLSLQEPGGCAPCEDWDDVACECYDNGDPCCEQGY